MSERDSRELRLLVTRPVAQATGMRDALRLRGVQAEILPLIGIVPVADLQYVHGAWRRLTSLDWLVFVSPNAVQQFFLARPAEWVAPWPTHLEVAAVGPGTVQALREAGVPPARITAPPSDARQVDSEALWTALAQRDWAGKQVLIVRGDGGRAWLGDQLVAQGAHLDHLQAYARRLPSWGAAEQAVLKAVLSEPEQHVWLISSSQAIEHLTALLQAMAPGLSVPWARFRALVTHPRIAERARAAGLTQVRSSLPDLDAMVACIQSSPW